MSKPHPLLSTLMAAGLAAADPIPVLARFLPNPPRGRTIVLGAGKAAASMAQAVEAAWPQPARLSGLVVTRYGYGGLSLQRITCLEAAHPVPDQACRDAAGRILESVQGLSKDDLVLALISGGGSSLLSLPAPGLTMDDKRRVTRALLESGAAIGEINCVRKHMSAIKGGRLAKAAEPAPVVTLAVSDVAGDDPATIASGPTVPDPTTTRDAKAILDRFGIKHPPAFSESVKPGALAFDFRLVLKPADMLAAVKARAEALGLNVIDLGDRVTGEAGEVAAAQAKLACSARPNTLILSGGELTVTLRGKGQGGPSGEYALALAMALKGAPNIHALAIDTDGIDGSQDNAGAFVGPETDLSHAADYLSNNDSYGFFAQQGGLILTGPTRTNLNDLRLVLVQ
jgi:glycerate-2-kinase